MVKATTNTDLYFSYNGRADFEEINTQLIRLNNLLDQENFHLVARKRIYAISIELLYNIVYHGFGDKEKKENILEFQITRYDDHVVITSSNFILHKESEKFRSTVCELGELTFQDLRKMKSKQILTGGISEKGGAGLGLIDIHMKSGHPVELNFKVHNKDTDWLTMNVRVDLQQ